MNAGGKRPHGHGKPPHPRNVGFAEDAAPGGGYLYQPGELVTTAGSKERVLDLLGELHGVGVRDVEDVVALGVTRVTLQPAEAPKPRRRRSRRGEPERDAPPPGVDVPHVIDELRRRGGPDLEVAPNHVLGRTSHPSMIGVTRPRPAPGRDALYEEPGLPGEGVRVGVLDTGALAHPYFAGRCVLPDPEDRDVADADGDGELDLAAGHGTFVVGTLLQHAPRATVVARRLPTANDGHRPHQEFLTDTALAEALVGLPGLGDLDVLTLAVGGYAHDGTALLATATALRTLRTANPDLVVVAGAGNEQTDEPFYPAAFADVVAVAALDAACRHRACFSNFGPWVDACAPGVDVQSTFLHWDGPIAQPPPAEGDAGHDGDHSDHAECDLEGGGDRETFEGWAYWHGTSFATPRVAAAIAGRISSGRSGREAVADVLHGPGHRRLTGLGTVVNPRSYP